MKCDICPSQARERSRYCAVCADHVMSVPEGRARVFALKRARRGARQPWPVREIRSGT
jgi:hypothetical protein